MGLREAGADGPEARALLAARRLLIGVHLTAASQDLVGTARALNETSAAFDLAVLVDPAPGEVLAEPLAALAGVRQLVIAAPAADLQPSID